MSSKGLGLREGGIRLSPLCREQSQSGNIDQKGDIFDRF